MIYWVWAVFKRMAPFKVITLDDRWDQMNRSFMMPLTMSFAYLIDYGIIAGRIALVSNLLPTKPKVARKLIFSQLYTD